MKHMNIIKKAAGAISILLIILSLAACGNAISENASSLSGVEGAAKNTVESISFKGQIKLQGAAPARSATSSFSGTITWVINAVSSDYSADHDQLISGAQASALTSENTFSMKIPKEGTYAFTVLGYPGSYSTIEQVASKTPLFQGYKTGVEITETGLRTALEITVAPLLTGTAPQNADSPVAETSDYGTIDLIISDISESISKLSATLTAYQREMDPIIKETTFDGGETTLHIENVPAGKYTAKLDFEDSNGNILYSCNEAINVYTGMTTDTWFGTAPYLTDGIFVINSALVSKYMLYEKYTDPEYNEYFRYYFTNDYSQNLPATATLSNSAADYNSFALDADGYYYVVTKTLEASVFIKSNRPGFCSEAASDTAYQYPGSMYLYGFIGDKVLVDRKTGFLYLIDKSNLATIGINRLSKDDGTYDYESETTHAYYPAKKFHIPESDANRSIVVDSTAFTIYGGIGYFVCMENDKLQIAVVDLRNTDSDTNVDAFVSSVLEIPNMNFSAGPYGESSLTDVMYMDGELYILERDYNTGGSLLSRGMIIKCNAITGEYTYKGYAPERQLMTYKSGCFYSNNQRGIYSVVYNSEDHSDYHIEEFSIENEENAISIQAPFDNLNSYFAGPNKFVAIKPKKLVISDTGIAFYTDTDGAVYFKDVNRIVEVDLKTLSITSSTDVQLSFDSPAEDNLSLSGFPTTTVTDCHIYASGAWDELNSATVSSTFTKK